MGENIVWFRLVHLKIYKSRYPLLGICFFIVIFAQRYNSQDDFSV